MARGVASSAEEEGGGEPVSQSVPGLVADFSAQSFFEDDVTSIFHLRFPNCDLNLILSQCYVSS